MLRQLAAGGGAGAITKTCIAPLERVKILMQLEGMKRGRDKQYKGVVQSLVKVATEEGVLSLWKGNGANVVRVVPVYALKFALNDVFKDMARALHRRQTPLATTAANLSFWEKALAGTLAGLFQIIATYPLEVVRTRLTMGPGLGIQYGGIMDCFSQTLRNEGVAGLYKGIGPTIASGAPYVGLQMSCYDALRTAIIAIPLCSTSDGNGGKRPTVLAQLACGAAAGVFAQTVTYPGDTIRRRMQTNGANGTKALYTDAFNCLRVTVAEEGVAGLYRGVLTNAVRSVPGAAIQFLAYETLQKLLRV